MEQTVQFGQARSGVLLLAFSLIFASPQLGLSEESDPTGPRVIARIGERFRSTTGITCLVHDSVRGRLIGASTRALVVWSEVGERTREVDLPRSGGAPQALAVSPDGKVVALARKESVVLVDVEQGQEIQAYAMPSATLVNFITADTLLCSSPASTRIYHLPEKEPRVALLGGCHAPPTKNGLIYLVSAAGVEARNLTGEGRGPLPLGALPLNARVGVSPDETLAVVLTMESPSTHKLRLFTVQTPREVFSSAGPAATCFAFSPDSQHLAVGGVDGKVRLYHLPARLLTAELEGESPPTSICFSSDSTLLWWADRNCTAYRVPVREARSWTSRESRMPCGDLAFMGPDRLAAWSHGGAGVRLWNWQAEEAPSFFAGALRRPGDLGRLCSSHGISLALFPTADEPSRLAVYPAAAANPLFTLALADEMQPVYLSPHVVATANDLEIAFFSAGDGQTLFRQKHPLAGHWVALSPTADLLIGVSERGGSVRAWDPASEAVRWELDGLNRACRVQFSARGDYLGIITGDGARIVDTATGEVVHQVDSARLHALGISQPLRWVAYNDETELCIADLARAKTWRKREHFSKLLALAIEDGAGRLASGSLDGCIRVWQLPQSMGDAQPTRAEIGDAWNSLSKDSRAAALAMVRLTAAGDASVQALDERLAKEGQGWIARPLARADERSLAWSQVVLAGSPEQALSSLQELTRARRDGEPSSPKPAARRLVSVLESIDSAQSRALLEKLAQQPTNEPLTCQATIVCERLKSRGSKGRAHVE